MACQFNSAELCPLDQLDPFIQDALDLVEFANGPVTSEWGAKRSILGHPAPFNMKMMGVGNEQWGPEYVERYARFAKVLKAKHPEISLIAAAGPSPDDDRFKFLWSRLRELNADVIDEHCYATPDWFLKNTHRYDSYDRNGPRVFMGEYAAQSDHTLSTKNRNNLESAIAEAAYLTGLERNADVVRLASYAPLFAHADAWQWTPDLIWVNNLTVVATANYYVQQLFSRNRGDQVLPTRIKLSAEPASGPATTSQQLFASATREDAAGEVILKVVNAANSASDAEIRLDGASSVGPRARAVVLTSASAAAVNSFDQPNNVAPLESVIENASSHLNHTFPAHSLTVIRVPVK
jgi:alpha-L-arabinofuranosidase